MDRGGRTGSGALGFPDRESSAFRVWQAQGAGGGGGSTREGRRIALFFTRRNRAGENFARVLAERAQGLPPLIQMSDALSRNVPKLQTKLETLWGNCNAHELDRAFDAAPTRPDLYFETALFLIKHGRYQRALDFLAQGLQVEPDTPKLLVTQAVIYAVLERSDKAEQLLAQIESRWPEWSLPYLFHGIILETHLKWVEGKSQINIALALGAQDPAAYYWLALADTSIVPPDIDEAKKAIAKGLELDGDNSSLQTLAGKVALDDKQYEAAIEHLTAAIRLDPDFAEAHEALAAAYRATREEDKSIAELKEVMRIKEKTAVSVQRPSAPSITNMLFRVRPPSQ
jgi:tetratricopeptide (TPR) repeat protein